MGIKEKIIGWLAARECVRNRALETVVMNVTCDDLLVFSCDVKNCIELQDIYMSALDLRHGYKILLVEKRDGR